eukprot:91472_1
MLHQRIKSSLQDMPIYLQDKSAYVATIYSRPKDHDQLNTAIHKQIKQYTVFNAVRFAIIAAVVFYVNYSKINELEGYCGYCCNCYYIASAPEYYGIQKDHSVDWSYCIPHCVDCNYCKQHYYNNATKSFEHTNQTCPAEEYNVKTQVKFKLDWHKGCPANISMTTWTFFLKDYNIYGSYILVFVILYIVGMINKISGLWLLLYNIIVSINAAYAMFQPMQYYHATITKQTPIGIKCEVSTINHLMSNVLTYCIYSSFLFIFSRSVFLGARCCIGRFYRDMRRSSIIIRCEKAMIISVVLLGAIFYVSLTVATVVMFEKRFDAHADDEDVWKIPIMIGVDLLAIASCFDVFCCPFGRQTCRDYFKKSDTAKVKTYEELCGISPDASNRTDIPLLDEDGAKEIRLWLDSIGFSMYYDILVQNGFDSMESIQEITDKNDLNDIGITLKVHQTRIIKQIAV